MTTPPLTNEVFTGNISNLTSNASGADYIYCTIGKPYDISKTLDLSLNVVASFILIMSFIANVLVLRGIHLTRHKPLSYLLIGNIAAAELIETIASPFIFYYFTRPWNWIFGKAMCALVFATSICSSIVVSSTLAAFSVYGCCILMRPKRRRLKTIVYGVLVCSWLWGLALAIPFAHISKVKQDERVLCNGKGYMHSCVFEGNSKDEQVFLNVALFVFRLTIPFVIIILSYGILLAIVKRLINRNRLSNAENIEMTDDLGETIGTGPGYSQTTIRSSSTDDQRQNSIAFSEMESKLLRLIFWMVVIYLVCYAPDHLIYFTWRSGWFQGPNKMAIRKHSLVIRNIPKLLHAMCFGWMAGIIQKNFKHCFRFKK